MKRVEVAHLLGLLAVAIAVRYVLFPLVGVWGDAGFYTYDAMLINSGQTPFVDFVGRSPLFNYSYAWATSVFGNGMASLRAFIVFWWIIAAFPVYYIGRTIDGHGAGLASVAVLQLSPFMLVYGYWANTQSLAAFAAIVGIALLVWRREWWVYGVSGMVFGAAFLSRRSVITLMVGIAAWMAYTALKNERNRLVPALKARLFRGSAFLAGFFVVIFAMYAWMANGDIGLTVALADTHAWGLISSSGRGGFPLVTESPAPSTQNAIDTGRIPILNDIFQMVGAWTARTFAKTTLVALPAMAPLFVYFRDWSDRFFSERVRDYTLGILLVLAMYGGVVAVLAGYWLRPLAVFSLVAVAVIVFRFEAIRPELLYDRHMVLLLSTMGFLLLGYLYRNRVLHTYYFSDFMPMLSVVAGVSYAALWRVIGHE